VDRERAASLGEQGCDAVTRVQVIASTKLAVPEKFLRLHFGATGKPTGSRSRGRHTVCFDVMQA
jgi:hypothetical protein